MKEIIFSISQSASSMERPKLACAVRVQCWYGQETFIACQPASAEVTATSNSATTLARRNASGIRAASIVWKIRAVVSRAILQGDRC